MLLCNVALVPNGISTPRAWPRTVRFDSVGLPPPTYTPSPAEAVFSTRAVAVTACMLGLAACDVFGGPEGPGSISATVTGAPVGGVLVEVTGSSILGFEGLESTQVYASAVPGSEDRYRVMLIHPEGGDLRFEIQMSDTGAEDPVSRVLSAVASDNSLASEVAIEVVLER